MDQQRRRLRHVQQWLRYGCPPSITTLSSTNLATISANLNMPSGSPTFTVSAGSVAGGVNLLASGRLFGGNGITKAGAGVMELTNTNTYTGVTTINEGTLQAVDGVGLPSASNLVFSGSLAQNGYGAVLQSSGAFIPLHGHRRRPGAMDGRRRLRGQRRHAHRQHESGTPLVWNNNSYFTGTLGFVPDGSALTFGSPTANSQVNFTDSIDLNGEIRQIDVAAGAGGDSALISGDIIDSLNNGQGGPAQDRCRDFDPVGHEHLWRRHHGQSRWARRNQRLCAARRR